MKLGYVLLPDAADCRVVNMETGEVINGLVRATLDMDPTAGGHRLILELDEFTFITLSEVSKIRAARGYPAPSQN